MSIGSGRSISLDDLVALNDEIAALTRAGVPLGFGLRSIGAEMPGRAGQTAVQIGSRLDAGESLPQILESMQRRGLPGGYAAVVAAGVRAGRLPLALESLAHSLRRRALLRRSLIVSLIYPLFVIALAYSLLLFTLDKTAPVLAHSYAEWNQADAFYVRAIRLITETRPIWKVAIPLFFVLYLLWVWRRVAWANHVATKPSRFGLSGNLTRMRLAAERGVLADLLAALLEHHVPLDEALLLAGQSSGSKQITSASTKLADSIRRGEKPDPAAAGFPPVIGSLVLSSTTNDAPRSLRRLADNYHAEAQQASRWIGVVVPLVFTFVFAGGIVVSYAALTVLPWFWFMQQLGNRV